MKKLIILAISLALLLTACGKAPAPSTDTEPVPGSQATESEQSESSEAPEEEGNPYGLEGLTMIKDAPMVYDVQKVATISEGAYSDQGAFRMSAMYDMGDGKLVVLVYYDKEDDPSNAILYSVDLGTGEMLASKEMGQGFSPSYIRANNGQLWYWEDPEVSTVTVMDYKFDLVKTVELALENGNNFTEDGSCWYIEDGKMKHNLLDGSEAESFTFDGLELTYMSSIFSDGQHIYSKVNGVNEMGYQREMMAVLDAKDTLFSQDADDSMVGWNVTDHTFISTGSIRLDLGNWNLVCCGGDTYSYSAPNQELLNVKWNNNGRILFASEDTDEEGNRIQLLWLYDSTNGMLEGMTRLPLAENDGGIINRIPIYPDGSLLLIVDEADSEYTGSSACTMYRWYPDREHTNGMEALSVEAGDFKDLPDLARKQNEYYYDPETYVPGTLAPELSDLKERANALGEKIGVNILLGDECRLINGSYVYIPVNDYDKIRTTLEILEMETTKYPEGFFRQVCEGYSGMDIYLTGAIRGLDGNTLSSAGGLASVIDDKICFAINVEVSQDDIYKTFHHELAHCIDRHINKDTTYTKLFDSEWNKLNPGDFSYVNSYVGNTPEKILKYMITRSDGTKNFDAYFIDSYAMNYATEDRARMMEYFMIDNSEIDYDKYPNLQKKLHYYAQCIRDRFDTTGWGEVKWEKY